MVKARALAAFALHLARGPKTSRGHQALQWALRIGPVLSVSGCALGQNWGPLWAGHGPLDMGLFLHVARSCSVFGVAGTGAAAGPGSGCVPGWGPPPAWGVRRRWGWCC